MSHPIPSDYTQFVDLTDEAKRLARQGRFLLASRAGSWSRRALPLA